MSPTSLIHFCLLFQTIVNIIDNNIVHNFNYLAAKNSVNFAYSDYEVHKTQNLGISFCIGKSESFCSEQVENSICNRLKNECFCKKGYVAIREEDRVTCKTLLTNLKCRVDSDCIHINRSTCHPGAGQCACPGNTVYSVELHACRSRFIGDQNPFCLTCQQSNGICFKYDPSDNTTISFKSKNDILGCACARNMATNIENYNQYSDLCRITLSDIGDFCDNKQYFCQSKNAECRNIREDSSSYRLCQCSNDKVPVYQSHLHYFECFSKLSKTSPHCLNCHNMEGQCYDMNNDDIGDGCVCPPRLSSESSNLDIQLDLQICKINTVHESCSNGYFSVCYQPHLEPPYEQLSNNLESNISIATLFSPYEEKCKLVKVNGHNKYCIRIDVLDQANNCGVQLYKLKFNKLYYRATLEVRMDHNIKQPSKDLIIPISCITSHFQRSYRNQSRGSTVFSKVFDLPNFSLGLQILDKYNKEVFSLVEGSEIKLDLSLIDPEGKYRGMRVEACYTSNLSTIIHEHQSNLGDKIISNGCPIFNNGFYASFKTNISPGIHLQSDMFQVFRHGNLHSTFYKCLIKICMDVKDCESAKCYNQDLIFNKNESILGLNQSKSLIIQRWAHIEVQKLQGYKNTKPEIDNTVCHHVVCLSASQTVLIALLLLFLLLMVIVLLIFYSRGKTLSTIQGPQRYAPSYFNSSIVKCKPKQSILSSEDNSFLSYRNPQPATLQKQPKNLSYMDTYVRLSPQIGYTVENNPDNDFHTFSNKNIDLQSNTYTSHVLPSKIISESKCERISEFVKFQEETTPKSSVDLIDPNYIGIRRSNISQLLSTHHQPHQSSLTQCSCGSKECEYQPFMLTSTST